MNSAGSVGEAQAAKARQVAPIQYWILEPCIDTVPGLYRAISPDEEDTSPTMQRWVLDDFVVQILVCPKMNVQMTARFDT